MGTFLNSYHSNFLTFLQSVLLFLPENHMINCILELMLTVLNRLTMKERGKILAARPIRIKIRLQMIRLKLKDVVMVNTCIPMYRNTTVSVEECVSGCVCVSETHPCGKGSSHIHNCYHGNHTIAYSYSNLFSSTIKLSFYSSSGFT